MGQIHGIKYWNNYLLKSPPTYAYSASKLAVLFGWMLKAPPLIPLAYISRYSKIGLIRGVNMF